MGPALTRARAAAIIAEAGLERGVWFERPTGKPVAVAIYETNGGYRVVSTDERAVEVGQRDYEDESDALEMYLVLLRDLSDLIASGIIR